MFTRKIKMKPVIAVPVSSMVPADIGVPVIKDGTFLEKMVANTEVDIAIMMLTTEELVTLVEKPMLFGVDVVALVGVPGARYDAVWSQYIAPLRRLTLETFKGEVAKLTAGAGEKEPPVNTPAGALRHQHLLSQRGTAPDSESNPDSDPEF